VVINGSGHIYTDTGREPSSKGDVISRRGDTGTVRQHRKEDVVLVWGWSGADRWKPRVTKFRRKATERGTICLNAGGLGRPRIESGMQPTASPATRVGGRGQKALGWKLAFGGSAL